MTPEAQATMDRLIEVVRNIPPERLALVLERSKRINFTVTPHEHDDIRATADAFGLTMTDYLLRIHALVSERIREEGRKR